ncbi:MAG: cytochrome c class I [Chitinophagaceae bacterium]|jgi:cytochrome c|nr:cytochrome c class I [Chitinophagaceae bacterium]
MKKTYSLLIMVALFIAACNSGEEKSETSETTTDAAASSTEDLSSNPVYQAGLAIEVTQDCATCHKVDTKIIGPSYREIANKYGSQPDTVINYLANKIITGGSGVWGPDVMTPHASLPQADAEALVRYILLLKNN